MFLQRQVYKGTPLVTSSIVELFLHLDIMHLSKDKWLKVKSPTAHCSAVSWGLTSNGGRSGLIKT